MEDPLPLRGVKRSNRFSLEKEIGFPPASKERKSNKKWRGAESRSQTPFNAPCVGGYHGEWWRKLRCDTRKLPIRLVRVTHTHAQAQRRHELSSWVTPPRGACSALYHTTLVLLLLLSPPLLCGKRRKDGTELEKKNPLPGFYCCTYTAYILSGRAYCRPRAARVRPSSIYGSSAWERTYVFTVAWPNHSSSQCADFFIF